jgi:hypothetical protein
MRDGPGSPSGPPDPGPAPFLRCPCSSSRSPRPGIALLAFLLDLIVNDPVSVAAMLVIVILAVILDLSLDPPTNLGS